jgi:hypothetical protein
MLASAESNHDTRIFRSVLPWRWIRPLSFEGASQLLPVGVAQSRTEVEDPIQQFIGLKVNLATGEVHVPAGSETPFFVVYNADTPTPPRDGLVAAAALGLPSRGSLGTVDTLEAFMRHASECRALEVPSIRHAVGCSRQRFEDRLRALIRRTQRMKPQGRLTLPKEIGNAFAKAQLSALNRLGAAAALGATA